MSHQAKFQNIHVQLHEITKRLEDLERICTLFKNGNVLSGCAPVQSDNTSLGGALTVCDIDQLTACDIAPPDQSAYAAVEILPARPPEAKPAVMTHEELNVRVATNRAYSFRENIWEITMVLGVHQIFALESMVGFVLLLLTVFLKLLICFVLAKLFAEASMAKQARVDNSRSWRTMTAHLGRLADNRGRSLVTRMCNSDPLEFSGMQQAEFLSVNSYLGTVLGYEIGAVVCSWCLFVWFLIIFNEVQEILQRFWIAIHLISSGHETGIYHSADGFYIRSISRHRFIFIFSFSIVRAGVAACLLCSGTLWLVYTESVTDLILNAAALAFVLDIDDLIFNVACPSAISTLICSLEPVFLSNSILSMVLPVNGLKALTTLLGACVLFGVTFNILLAPELERLRDTWEQYCGGRKDFVLAENPLSGIVYTYEYNNSQATIKSWEGEITQQLVTDQGRSLHYPTYSWQGFKEAINMDLLDVIAQRADCLDFPPEHNFFLTPLRRALTSKNVFSCGDIHNLDCLQHPMVRVACPATCGCNVSLSGFFMLRGCPLAKCTTTPQFQHLRESARYFDIERALLHIMPEWHMYWGAYKGMMKDSVHHALRESPEFVADKFLEFGCDAFALFRAEGRSQIHELLCSGNDHSANLLYEMTFRPLGPFCPQSCECSWRRAYQGVYCPKLIEKKPDPVACPGLHVIGGALVVKRGCNQTLQAESNPEGWYSCQPLGYNGKHLYQYHDSARTLWAIRWETDANLDWGARFLGGQIGLAGKSKWTLISIDADRTVGFEGDSQLTPKGEIGHDHYPIVARFFAEGSPSLLHPMSTIWMSRSKTTSDADCAAGSMTTQGSDLYLVGPSNTNFCPNGYVSINSTAECFKSAIALGLAEEEYHVWAEDPNLRSPHGCYKFTDSPIIGSVYFNPGFGAGNSNSYPICALPGF